jgi:hypothetical protein
VFGNLFAFFAGLGAAGLFSYFYPRMRGEQRAEVKVWRTGESSPLRELMDLNVATEEELQALAGIGPALAGASWKIAPIAGSWSWSRAW